MNADVFALTAVGVGIEVADEGTLHCGPRAGIRRERQVQVLRRFRQRKCQVANGARLGVAHGGASGVANGVDGGLGLLAEPNDQESLGLQPDGGVEEDGLVGAGLIFAAGEHSGCGGADGFVAGQENRLRFSVRALGGLGVDGGDGEKFGFDLGEGRERKVCAHT